MFIQHLPALLLAGMLWAQAPQPPGSNNQENQEKWIVTKGCALQVNGRTNVNTFSCSINSYAGPDTLTVQRSCRKAQPVALSGYIGLPVTGFDCMNRTMTNDLRKTLKASEYPRMRITFVSLQQYPAENSGEITTCGAVIIELAGTARQFNINYRISRDAQQLIHLEGTQVIRFSDFNLNPPKKFGGMVRANDLLEVAFDLNFKKA